MEVKNKIYTFLKMFKDAIPEKTPDGVLYHARNIRFTSADKQIAGGFHFEKGNKLSLIIPSPRINWNNKAIEYDIHGIENEEVVNTATKRLYYDVPVSNSLVIINSPRNEIEKTYSIKATGPVLVPYSYKTSGKQRVVGYVETNKELVLFTTDGKGFDCIWTLEESNNRSTLNLELKYMRDMGFEKTQPIEAIFNYESERIRKIYWVSEGKHQLRHLNLEHSIENEDNENLIDLEVTLINAISKVNISQPTIVDVTFGGTHTSGMIQYAYVLYKLNGSQTSLSPVSELVPLGQSSNQGGDVNQEVGAAPVVSISNIDTRYDNIIIYGIKYTSLNTTPDVFVIEDRSIPADGNITVYDNGTVLRNENIENLLLVNNSLNFPASITSKNNRLIYADYTEKSFEFNIDTRAYSFPQGIQGVPPAPNIPPGPAKVYNNLRLEGEEVVGDIRTINPGVFTDDFEDEFDSVNLDYNTFRYQANGFTLGAEGKYLKIGLTSRTDNEDGEGRFLKDNEIYRIGIKFFNIYGQETEPMWVCDIKAPQRNLTGKFNIVTVQLKEELINLIAEGDFDSYTKPTGYKLLIAERKNDDKTILISGIVSPTTFSARLGKERNESKIFVTLEDDGTFPVQEIASDDFIEFDEITKTIARHPSPLLRNAWIDKNKVFRNTEVFKLIDSPMQRARHWSALDAVTTTASISIATPQFPEWNRAMNIAIESPASLIKKFQKYVNFQDSALMQIYSPESIFGTNPTMTEDCTLEVRYGLLNIENGAWRRIVDLETNAIIRESERAVTNLLSPLIRYGEDNFYPVNHWMGDTDLEPVHFPWWNNPGPLGYVRFGSLGVRNLYTYADEGGMFSNTFGNEFRATDEDHHFVTILALYYRRYGNKVNEMIELGGNFITNPRSEVNWGLIDSSNYINILPKITSNTPGITFENSINGLINTIDLTRQEFELTKSISTTISLTLNSSEFLNPAIRITLNLNGNQTITKSLDRYNTVILELSDEIDLSSLGEDFNTVNNSIDIQIDGVTSTDSFDLSSDFEITNYFTDENDDIILEATFSGSNSDIYVDSNTVAMQIPGIMNRIPNVLPVGSNGAISYKIYGKPEITKQGQGIKNYNGNGVFKYTNNFNNYMNDHLGTDNTKANKEIRKINSEGADCVTFVLNPAAAENHLDATKFEDVVQNAGISINSKYNNGGSIYAEIVKSKKDIYLGGIYGGNSYEDRKRTYYLEIGDFYNIDTERYTINNPGDTYVQDFKFLRVIRGSQEQLDPSTIEHEEIVEYPTETTINLKKRNDESILEWSSKFSYEKEEYMKYNKVYSQSNNLKASRALDYTFKKVNRFGNNIRSSRFKTTEELYDSWLQTQVNEELSLDGKYGKVTDLLDFNDNVVAIQERAVSRVNIQPRVQTTSNDGYNLQLGTGEVLDSYNYLTTNSGSLKRGSITTPYGIYYLDSRTKTLNSIQEGVEEVSKVEGFNKWFQDNIDYSYFKDGNNILKDRGYTLGFDKTRGDLYITYRTTSNFLRYAVELEGNIINTNTNKNWTLSYNVAEQGFTSFYDYNSDFYLPLNTRLFSINPNYESEGRVRPVELNNEIYELYKGKPTTFYKEQKGAEITFITNPEHLVECTFNNLEFSDRSYDEDNKETIYTFDTIKIENEFQNSGEVELVPRVNLRKLNRKWRVNIPRDKENKKRIMNTWSKITLKNSNESDMEHEFQDFVLYYLPRYKKLT